MEVDKLFFYPEPEEIAPDFWNRSELKSAFRKNGGGPRWREWFLTFISPNVDWLKCFGFVESENKISSDLGAEILQDEIFCQA